MPENGKSGWVRVVELSVGLRVLLGVCVEVLLVAFRRGGGGAEEMWRVFFHPGALMIRGPPEDMNIRNRGARATSGVLFFIKKTRIRDPHRLTF